MITSNELQDVLVAAGIPTGSIQIYDEEYVMTTPEWVTKNLGAAMNKFFFDTGIKFQYDQYDCNKFSKTASTIADWCWATTKIEEAALAFGLFGFISGAGAHMINIAVHRDAQSKLYLAFYEPQPSVPDGQQTFSTVCLIPQKLDEESIRSCISCLFL